MATPKTAAELATEAETLATSFEYVKFNGRVYAPVDCETGDDTVIPPVDRKCWVPLSQTDIQQKARVQFDTLFRDDRQLNNFIFMVQQIATFTVSAKPWLLVKTEAGLKVLREDGKLYDPDGTFVPNMLVPVLNTDPDDKAELMSIITNWLGDEKDEAMSLLSHLATSLAPHWSAGKYVLLIGDGRNGKSVLMTMLQDLFGRHNCSGVERQVISDSSPGAFDLNGKLLNLVFDGPIEFVKDSGREKSIITGEQINVRKLYTNEMSVIQTNALFLEGLNQEPKSRDKSSALQARLVRFRFPNKYAEDDVFFERMRSERMLGALLSLLIDNYVLPSSKAVMLAPTAASMRLQMEHMEENSLAVQFVVHLEETEALGAEATLVDAPFDDLVTKFLSWRLQVNDLTAWDKSSLLSMFNPVLSTARKSARIAGKTNPVKVRTITGLKSEVLVYLESLKEDVHATTVVDDGSV
jgi:hypothetical protein